MTDPFRIEGPACISFSGGRTSAYMLRRILDACGGGLLPDVHAVFTNTGREMEPTYDFVRECSGRWGVLVVWAELSPTAVSLKPEDPRERFVIVDHATAARNGEPLTYVWEARGSLSNVRQRSCTQEAKLSVMKHYMLANGYDHWDNVIGLRADEPQRVMGARKNAESQRWSSVAPLYAAGVRKADVLAWWAAQPFDLRLAGPWEGNCDGCFLKKFAHKVRVAEDHPERWAWWVEQERLAKEKWGAASKALFRVDHPTTETIARVARQPKLPIVYDSPAEDEEETIPCTCTD